VRLAHGRERNDAGMGLGLGIARGIVEGHGGQLLLANHAGGGLDAVIRLPVGGGGT
jgi:signal transduction histidine kinase